MRQPQACILGGTGFVGRHLLLRLSKAGWHCRIPTRYPHRHRDLALYRGVSLQPVPTIDADGLASCMDDADLVVNLIGILNEGRAGDFQRVHVELVSEVVTAALAAGVPRYLHMSALHADAQNGSSTYLRSKGAGEDLAHSAEGLAVTSFRPSVVFGRGDSFFNRFATLLQMTPGLFPLACPDARFAPVWVGDLTEAMLRTISDDNSIGRRYDLCGPRIFSLEELVAYTAAQIGRRTLLMGLNDFGSRLQARVFEHLPGTPFTMDNYRSMQTASTCAEHNGLLELGIHPTDVDTIVPTYLGAAGD
jgi:uncharacterized protein YbjT (DUF2867 family)